MHWIINPKDTILEKFKEFSSCHEKTNFFQSYDFVKLYSENGYRVNTIVGIENDQVVASFNFLILSERNRFLAKVTSRAVTWGLPLLKDESILNEIIKELLVLFRSEFIYFEIRPLYTISQIEKNIFKQLKFNCEQHYSIFHDLSEIQFEKYHAGRKKNIRRAQRNQYLLFRELQTKNEFEMAGEMINDLYSELKLPCPNKSFFSQAGTYKSIKSFGVFYGDELVACRFVLLYKHNIYDWFAAASQLGKINFANDLIVDEIFKWGKSNNFNHFDFGGAGKEHEKYGVREYKLKFGGQLVEVGRLLFISKPVLFRIGKFGFSLLKLLRK